MTVPAADSVGQANHPPTEGRAMIDTTLAEITVTVGDPPKQVTFDGCWLVHPKGDDAAWDGEPWADGDSGWTGDAGARYGLALATEGGQIGVYSEHCNEMWPARLTFYRNLDDVAGVGVPENVVASAEAAYRRILAAGIMAGS